MVFGAVIFCDTDSFVVLFQGTHCPAGADDFADCPSCDMLDWSRSQQVDDLMSLLFGARPFLSIGTEKTEVPTCVVQDWSPEQQEADPINYPLQVFESEKNISGSKHSTIVPGTSQVTNNGAAINAQ